MHTISHGIAALLLRCHRLGLLGLGRSLLRLARKLTCFHFPATQDERKSSQTICSGKAVSTEAPRSVLQRIRARINKKFGHSDPE